MRPRPAPPRTKPDTRTKTPQHARASENAPSCPFPAPPTQSSFPAITETFMRNRLALISLTAIAACSTFGPAMVPPVATLTPSAQTSAESLLAINALCSAEALGADKIAPDIKLAEGMGTGGFKVDTNVPAAQEWFDYGLALSHAFYHQDVKAAMKRAVELDPACSMCSWGEPWPPEGTARIIAAYSVGKSESREETGQSGARRRAQEVAFL